MELRLNETVKEVKSFLFRPILFTVFKTDISFATFAQTSYS